jgi:hypothetical protein
VRGFTNALISPYESQWRRITSSVFPYNLKRPFIRYALPYNTVAFFTFFVIGGLCLLLPSLMRRYGRDIAFILFTLGVLSVFFTYWEPRHVEFWLIPAILFTVLGILIMNLAVERLATVFGKIVCIPFYAVLFCLIVVIGFHNIENFVVPFTKNNRLEEIEPAWEEDYYMKLFSTYIYKNPDNPYKLIYRESTVRPEK